MIVALTLVSGHGRLMNPPARNAMWRFGYPNPVNYNDNELYCGGYAGKIQLKHNIIFRLIKYIFIESFYVCCRK